VISIRKFRFSLARLKISQDRLGQFLRIGIRVLLARMNLFQAIFEALIRFIIW